MSHFNLLSEDKRMCESYLQDFFSTDCGDDGMREYDPCSMEVPWSIGIVPIVDPFFIPVLVDLPPVSSNRPFQPSESHGAEVSSFEPEIVASRTKRFPYCQVMLDALRQTVVPEVPQHSPEVVVASSLSVNEITPSLDFFSNDVIYYNNGVIERPRDIEVPQPLSPAWEYSYDNENESGPEMELESHYMGFDCLLEVPEERKEVVCESL